MESCDVLVIGGGPAGSSCAGKLREAGADVLLLDKARFPREKPCAGWITPAVFETLGLDPDEYRQGRILQEISSFRTGLMNGSAVVTRYNTTVSYGIRRSEFDHFLLQRCHVQQLLGESAVTLGRADGWWVVNGRIKARLLVGAGGHFCPVARLLGAGIGREAVVAARAGEYALSEKEARTCRIQPGTPELFFSRDMKGYGWLFRKENYLNIGLGRADTGDVNRAFSEFSSFLTQRGDLPGSFRTFQGHAYQLFSKRRRRCVHDGALLIGDAAGLASPLSGEGILPAIESALMAAETIVSANGDYRREKLEPYPVQLTRHFSAESSITSRHPCLSKLSRYVGARLLSSSWFTRHVVLDRWFLHAGRVVQ